MTRPPKWARPRGRSRCPAGGFVAYSSESDAQAAALRVSRHLGPMRAYRCDRCPGWHLTTWRTAAGA